MRDIIISAGHSDGKGESKDRGSSANGYIEGDLAIELRDLLVKELKDKHGITVRTDNNSNALVATLQWLKSFIKSNSIAVDLHWNAGGGTGIEVIVPDNPSGFEQVLAQSLADKISDLTTWKKRGGGVKKESDTARKKLGWMRPLAENVLIEMCFIDNKLDMAVYQANKKSIASIIAAVLVTYAKA